MVVLEVFYELDLIVFKIKWFDCYFIYLFYVFFVDKKKFEDENKILRKYLFYIFFLYRCDDCKLVWILLKV